MKIDPKQIARMISEDPDGVVPSNHFDDTEDEYVGEEAVTFYVVEVPTEHSGNWEESEGYSEYGTSVTEYAGEDTGGPLWDIRNLKERINKLKKSLWEAQVTIDKLNGT